MTKRLATICFATMFSIGFTSLSAQAQSEGPSTESLKGIDALTVLVEKLPDGAKVLGLTVETIQTDVELKLRLAGLRIGTEAEHPWLPGMPYIYVRVTLTEGAEAASIEVELDQNVRLERNGQIAYGVATWQKIYLLSNPKLQTIRDKIKDLVDMFLNAWLSVNPKK